MKGKYLLALVSIFLFFFATNCSLDIDEEIKVLKSNIEEVYPNLNKLNGSPSKAYHEAVEDMLLFFNKYSLSEEQQWNVYLCVDRAERSILEVLCRSFRLCVNKIENSTRDYLDIIYNNKLTSEGITEMQKDSLESQLELQKEKLFIWMMGISDTIAVFDKELISVLTEVEEDFLYFGDNCKAWEGYIQYMQRRYNLNFDELPCNINTILKINGVILIEKVEHSLVDTFDARLHTELWGSR